MKKPMRWKALTPDILMSESMLMMIEKIKETSCPAYTVKVYHYWLEEPKERHFSSERDADDFINFLTYVSEDNINN